MEFTTIIGVDLNHLDSLCPLTDPRYSFLHFGRNLENPKQPFDDDAGVFGLTQIDETFNGGLFHSEAHGWIGYIGVRQARNPTRRVVVEIWDSATTPTGG